MTIGHAGRPGGGQLFGSGQPVRAASELTEPKLLARDIVNRECITLELKFLTNDPEREKGGGKGGMMTETLVDGTLDRADWARLDAVAESSGLATALLPEKYGRAGMGMLEAFVLAEELNRSPDGQDYADLRRSWGGPRFTHPSLVPPAEAPTHRRGKRRDPAHPHPASHLRTRSGAVAGVTWGRRSSPLLAGDGGP